MNSKTRTTIISLIGLITLVAVVARRTKISPLSTNNANTSVTNSNLNSATNTATSVPPTNLNTNTAPAVQATTVVVPIADFFSRITKKPFGIYITPKTSPVQPEKFTGYHTGADAETTPAEAAIDVPIFSVADGAVVFAGHVNGYGGVMMIRNKIGSETVTILYGHLRISSFTKKVGTATKKGEKIAVLGTGYSSETDGERKHLHFGVIKGANINYKGYVQSKSALSAWEDPVAWLLARGAK